MKSQEYIASILADIGPMTKKELDEFTGLSSSTVAGHLAQMKRKPLGDPLRVVVSHWEQSGKGTLVPHLALSPCDDSADKPKPKPRNEINRHYWERARHLISARRYGERSRINALGVWRGLL